MNFKNYKNDFPIFANRSAKKPLVYLDSGATTQKPKRVIDAITYFYENDNANVHRGIYALSEDATAAYENVREKVRAFVNAKFTNEIIFTRGTTESINLVAYSYGLSQIGKDDEIIISAMEHHSNIVPWQMLCEQTGAKLKVIPVTDQGELDLNAYQNLLSDRVKLVAVIHVSNVLGTVNPIKQMIELAHERHIPVLIDGAQAVGHRPIDVQQLDCDFYVFSAHKLYGPTGVGVLYGKQSLLEKMPPYQTGGDMISRVTFEKTDFNVLPYKFEAGTPNIAGVVGLGAAIDYVSNIGFENIMRHEAALLSHATDVLNTVSDLKIYGTSKNKSGVIAFDLAGVHPHDIATILDQDNIAIRAGHHCAMPLIERFGVSALSRISFGIYNQSSDIDALVHGLHHVKKMFGV